MLRTGGVLLLAVLLAVAAPGGALRVMGNLDPGVAAWLVNQGMEVRIERLNDAAIRATDPDVVVVTSEDEVPPALLRAHIEAGRAVIASNSLPSTYFEPLGLAKDPIQRVNIQLNPNDPVVLAFDGPVSGRPTTVRVYWHAATRPDTLYSFSGSFDLQRTYGPYPVVVGRAVGPGYLLVYPSAALRSDTFYAENDPGSPTTQNQGFLLEAIRYVFQHTARAPPSPAAVSSSTPVPASPPAPSVSSPAASPPGAPPAPPIPQPPASTLGAVAAVVVAVMVVVALVVVKGKKRPPPPAEAPGVGLGKEEVPPAPPTGDSAT